MKVIRYTTTTQRGAALAIGLILLAVASLATITSISTGVMQERMTANQDNKARSFMAAEAGGASLVDWINANGWPTASRFPPSQSNVVPADPSIRFTMTLQSPSWADSPLAVIIEGQALSADGVLILARTQLLVELERRTGPPPPAASRPIPAPATISCFGGPCELMAGSGRGADEGFGTVSGFDHPIPPLDCSGGGCRMQPQGDNRTLPAVPAVFLTNPTGSSVGVQGGGKFNAYQGLNRAGTANIAGRTIDVARRPIDYPNDPATGAATAPTWGSVFGTGGPPPTRLESGRTALSDIGGSNVEVGTLVLNGDDLTMRGNALFVGLIIIRNCGTLNMGVNSNVYGAVIIEAVRADGSACPANYNPFGAGGTPAIRYSSAALQRAAEVGGGLVEVAVEVAVLQGSIYCAGPRLFSNRNRAIGARVELGTTCVHQAVV